MLETTIAGSLPKPGWLAFRGIREIVLRHRRLAALVRLRFRCGEPLGHAKANPPIAAGHDGDASAGITVLVDEALVVQMNVGDTKCKTVW
jgi:hypothetical protein